MRFASIGASNAGSYAAAGKAVADSGAAMFKKQRETGPDYAGLSRIAMTAASAEKVAATKTAADVYESGIQALSTTKQGAIKGNLAVEKTKYNVKEKEYKNKSRMAGILPAVGKIVGSAFKKDPKRPPPLLQVAPVKPETVTRGDDAGDRPQAPTRRKPEAIPTSLSSASTTSSSSSVSSPSTGSRRELADAVAKYESGDHGYDAFNQGGTDGGTKVVGLSGSHATHFGKPLTSMTVGQVIERQSGYDDFSISDKQWRDNGGLHAVGRYQFIGPTLKDEVSRMGLSMDTMFDAKTQDDIFFSHAKRVGNISPWVGPSNNYNQSQKDYYNSIIRGL